MEGPYALAHRGQISGLFRHVAALEMRRHPLERLITLRDSPRGLAAQTTGAHLARRLGDAVARAHAGDLAFRYGTADRSVRIRWRR